MVIKLTKGKPHKRMRTIDKICSVLNCTNRVLEGNYFLCEWHYFHCKELTEADEYYVGRSVSRR